MMKYKIICPKCGAWIVTEEPKSLIWERCPGCRQHDLDIYDVMMAEVLPTKPSAARATVSAN